MLDLAADDIYLNCDIWKNLSRMHDLPAGDPEIVILRPVQLL